MKGAQELAARMRFPPSFLDEIKARLPVSEVVRRRVKLQKSGREWKGLSPFNQEKTPSFFVNDQKMAWFDFSSGRNGNVFDFVMETEGLSFPEAVERLALEAGVAMPMRSEEAEREESRAKGLIEAMALAAEFFVAELSGPRGAKARNYLENRGLSRSVWAEFGLGFAPAERFALRDFLAGKGVSAEVMKEAGLLVFGEDIAVPLDIEEAKKVCGIPQSGVWISRGACLNLSKTSKDLLRPHKDLTCLWNTEVAKLEQRDGKWFLLDVHDQAIVSADKVVIDAIQLVRLPYHLSAITQVAAEVALEFKGELLAEVKRLSFDRDRLIKSLNELGLTVIPSEANFILFKGFKQSSHELWETLLAEGVLIRDVGLPGYLRVTIGNEAENQAFLKALKGAL